MKKTYALILLCILSTNIVLAVNKHWVGLPGASWSNGINWSLSNGGAGGAGAPTIADDVFFNNNARVFLDVSPTIRSLSTVGGPYKVVIYTSLPSNITVTSKLYVAPFGSLKDSTIGNVPFNFVFNAPTGATGTIMGDWIFEGGSPLIGGSGAGASFSAPAGTVVTVTAIQNPVQGGRIIQKKNTKPISSTASSLIFDHFGGFVSDNNPEVTIPLATWAADVTSNVSPYQVQLPPASITLSGSLEIIHILGTPDYGNLNIDLPLQAADLDLGLPNGSNIKGNLTISNTNNYKVTLLAQTSASSNVSVTVGDQDGSQGQLAISGATTKVSLARALPLAPATNYKLVVVRDYIQSGGNFSLQDYNSPTGSSSLAVRGNFTQTGGTFFTNSTTTDPAARFQLAMIDPFIKKGPSGLFSSVRDINASSGTIDNGRNMVTLRIDHSIMDQTGQYDPINGIRLQSPLIVGKLDLASSPLTTTATNILTVTNTASSAIAVGAKGNSYVNGPMRRMTNATDPCMFPVGKGNTIASGFHLDSCLVIPAVATASVYQAEYFNTTPPAPSIAAPLSGIAASEYWSISKLSGADAKIRLILNSIIPGATAANGIVVAYQFKGIQWVAQNGTILHPGNASAGSVTSKTMSNFGRFTFGYGNIPAFPIIIGTLAEKASSSSAIAGSISTENSEDALAARFFPNPFVENVTVDYNVSNANDKVDINLYDLKGRLICSRQLGNNTLGRNTGKIELAGKNLTEGVYMAELRVNGKPVKTVKLLKAVK